VFAREVEPGVFVYSLDHRLPVATRKLVAEMVDAGAASTRQAAQAFRQAIAARRNGHQS
jgi:hypothetical protein